MNQQKGNTTNGIEQIVTMKDSTILQSETNKPVYENFKTKI
jgi:hypothetical protein